MVDPLDQSIGSDQRSMGSVDHLIGLTIGLRSLYPINDLL